jgi:hypothetical protein
MINIEACAEDFQDIGVDFADLHSHLHLKCHAGDTAIK